jgi:hypothetical protein
MVVNDYSADALLRSIEGGPERLLQMT